MAGCDLHVKKRPAVYIHTFPGFANSEGLETMTRSSNERTLSTQIWVSNPILSMKEPGPIGEMTILGWGQEIEQMSTSIACCQHVKQRPETTAKPNAKGMGTSGDWVAK